MINFGVFHLPDHKLVSEISIDTKYKVYEIFVDKAGNETRVDDRVPVTSFPPSRAAARLNHILTLIKPLMVEYLILNNDNPEPESNEVLLKIKKMIKEFND